MGVGVPIPVLPSSVPLPPMATPAASANALAQRSRCQNLLLSQTAAARRYSSLYRGLKAPHAASVWGTGTGRLFYFSCLCREALLRPRLGGIVNKCGGVHR